METDRTHLNSKNVPQDFATTQWSLVVAAGNSRDSESHRALSHLCELYWYPLYVYVRRRVGNVADAQDATQSFFAVLLEKDLFAHADPNRGRFRTFLLTAMKNFLTNQWKRGLAKKRGGDRMKLSLDFHAGESEFRLEPKHELTAEKLYERRWVTTLLDRVLVSLHTELDEQGKSEHYDQFKQGLTGDTNAIDYSRAAAALEISQAAAKQAAYRLRKRYRQLLWQEVARTVGDESEVEAEIGNLLASLAE